MPRLLFYILLTLAFIGLPAILPSAAQAAACPSQDTSILQRFDTNPKNGIIDDPEVTNASVAWTNGSPGAPNDTQMSAIVSAWTSGCQIGGSGGLTGPGSSGSPPIASGLKSPQHIDGYGLSADILNDLNGDGAFNKADCDLLSRSYFNPATGQDLRNNPHFDFNHSGAVGADDVKACQEAFSSGGKVTAQSIGGSAPMGDTVSAQPSAYIRIISINNTSATVAVAVNAPSLIGKLNQCSIRWGDGQNSITANISPSLKEQQYTHQYPQQIDYVAVFSCTGPQQASTSGQVMVRLSQQGDTVYAHIGTPNNSPLSIDLRVTDVNAGHVTVSATVSPVSAVAFCNAPDWGDSATNTDYVSVSVKQPPTSASQRFDHDYRRSGSYVITWSCMDTNARLAQRSIAVKVDVPQIIIRTGGVAAQAAEVDQGITSGGVSVTISGPSTVYFKQNAKFIGLVATSDGKVFDWSKEYSSWSTDIPGTSPKLNSREYDIAVNYSAPDTENRLVGLVIKYNGQYYQAQKALEVAGNSQFSGRNQTQNLKLTISGPTTLTVGNSYTYTPVLIDTATGVAVKWPSVTTSVWNVTTNGQLFHGKSTVSPSLYDPSITITPVAKDIGPGNISLLIKPGFYEAALPVTVNAK